jgi:hypothetical protein
MASAALWAAGTMGRYVKPVQNNVGIYRSMKPDASEQPLFKVGNEDRLVLVEIKGDFLRVQNVDGVSGWVERKLMVSIGSNKAFSFDKADVIGYLDNPTPVYIIDVDDPNAERISLDRSFKEALKDNIDKVTIERQVR